MTAFAGLAILHAAIASDLIEALLRGWRVGRPGERIVLRWLALLAPLTLTHAYAWLAPFRSEPAFRLERALFSGSHWDVLSVGGVPFSLAATGFLAAAGLALLLRDVVPGLTSRIRIDSVEPQAPGPTDPARRVERLAADAASLLGLAVPRLRLVARAEPVLLCTGVERPTIEVSQRTLELLDDDALRSALLHEMVHVRHRDALHGWILIAIRAVQFFNPAAHIVARLIVQDIEERADKTAARLGGAQGLAEAIARLSDSDEHGITDLAPRQGWRGVLAHAYGRSVRERCNRVSQHTGGRPQPLAAALRVTCAATGLAILLFLVV